jgi:hypothetical protein
MPKDDFDFEDPLEIVGCEVPLTDAHLTEMAECFISEFARMGWNDAQLLAMFRNPFYRGPYSVLQIRGEDYLRYLIQRYRNQE